MATRGAVRGERERAIAEYYDASVAGYDATCGYGDPTSEAELAPIIEELKDSLRDREVLEIACGTGYWTAHVAKVARAVVAIDVAPTMLEAAAARLGGEARVRLQQGDAYALGDLPRGFDGAFAAQFWCHVPRARLRGFLEGMHAHLRPGSPVWFICQLPDLEAAQHATTADGDRVAVRAAQGRHFEIVKNVPTEADVHAALAGLASSIDYAAIFSLGLWRVSYRVA